MKPQEFVDALDSDELIAARALCRRVGACLCAKRLPCTALSDYGEEARAVLKALSARKRLMVNRP